MGMFAEERMKELEGEKVTALLIGDRYEYAESLLVFKTDGGQVAYAAHADCCSESWFADINGIDALIGATVLKAETVSMDGYNVEDGRTRQEYDEAYGWKLTTDRGYVDIVMRNSSNGYYGGWVDPYDGDLPDDLRDISDGHEWSA